MGKIITHRALMCIATAILFCAFGWSVLHVRHFVNNAVEGRGHVIGLARSSSKNGSVFKPVVEFHTVGGARMEFTSSMGTSPPSHDVGESVTVYYDPEDPHSAMLSDWISLWGGPMILGAITAVFAFLTFIIYFRVSFRTPRKRGRSAKA